MLTPAPAKVWFLPKIWSKYSSGQIQPKLENDDLEYFVLLMFNKGSAVAEMSDCLATIDMGRKLGVVPLLGGGSWVLL